MNKIINWLNESLYINKLSLACKMCAKGSKMVVLVTGMCNSNCYYCPLSFKKGNKDLIFADEWQLRDGNDIKKLFKEAELIDAEGAGITGGDPLVVWKRTKKYIEILKERFGRVFHIHLYTSSTTSINHILELIKCGLDEIRFHPSPYLWNKMEKSNLNKIIQRVTMSNAEVAIEIPSIPNMQNQILSMISWADKKGIDYINLNELEFSERNCKELINRNYQVKNEISAGVKGSQETAEEILEKVKEDLKIGVHYCSVSFKDGIQLKNRIKRRAENIAK
ncbi:MAG: radical SAM protein, partial [Candidatus Lokiarchaeota archaeon]|nr:radical SAM protein [Candidatus Lokiarchaeota archaeon]